MKFLFRENKYDKYDNLATIVASDRSPFFATEGTLMILSQQTKHCSWNSHCIVLCGGWKYRPKSSNYCTPRHTRSEEWGDVGWGGGQHMTGRINSIQCNRRATSHNGGYLPQWMHSSWPNTTRAKRNTDRNTNTVQNCSKGNAHKFHLIWLMIVQNNLVKYKKGWSVQ